MVRLVVCNNAGALLSAQAILQCPKETFGLEDNNTHRTTKQLTPALEAREGLLGSKHQYTLETRYVVINVYYSQE
jgi:hypothetical protein